MNEQDVDRLVSEIRKIRNDEEEEMSLPDKPKEKNKKLALYKVITGDELLTNKDEDIEPIIEGVMYPQDYILITARQKRGKTILAQQLACALSSGTPFLGTFEVTKPVKVWYLATEGKINSMKERFIRMSRGVPIIPRNILFIPTFFRFNTPEGEKALRQLQADYMDDLPDVVIVDALFRAVKGTLKDDDVVNDFHHIITEFANISDAAIVVVHHLKKPGKDKNGKTFAQTDDDVFGSAFLTAAADHVFRMERCNKEHNHYIMSCESQRSGDIVDKTRLKLYEPDPLYFDVVSMHYEEMDRMREILAKHPDGLTNKELMDKAKIRKGTYLSAKKDLLKNSEIYYNDDYPKKILLGTKKSPNIN